MARDIQHANVHRNLYLYDPSYCTFVKINTSMWKYYMHECNRYRVYQLDYRVEWQAYMFWETWAEFTVFIPYLSADYVIREDFCKYLTFVLFKKVVNQSSTSERCIFFNTEVYCLLKAVYLKLWGGNKKSSITAA